MGWESRDWAKWTDEERRRFYGASVGPAVDTTRPDQARRLVWVGVGALALLVVSSVGWLKLTSPTVSGAFVSSPSTVTHSTVVYGWRDIPPQHNPWLDMSSAPRDALGGVDFVCTARNIDRPSGRWVCVEYTVINEPGTLIVEPSDPNATQAQPPS